MKNLFKSVQIIFLSIIVLGCDHHENSHHSHHKDEYGHHEDEIEKGPHGGRMLRKDDFALELSIYETGVPSEYRVWVTNNNQPVPPDQVRLNISLTRLGGKVNNINFIPQGNFLRGDTEIYEPHSFVVSVEAFYKENAYSWQYESFEGRTTILPEIAKSFDLKTGVAGAQELKESITLYGKIVAIPKYKSEVSARFDGTIESVHVSLGDTVKKGQVLAKIESNESLNTYNILSPINGVVTDKIANKKEQTRGRQLFTITDTSTVWANLQIFPSELESIKKGATVIVTPSIGGKSYHGEISSINILADDNQSVTARVELTNTNGLLLPGIHITGRVIVDEYTVPLAVKRTALQQFRDFTVVYAQVENDYEVRILELGRQDEEWAEVLGGLEPGTQYVTNNSYLVKADIEKSGAAHDH